MDFVIPVRQSNRHFTVDEKNAILDENEKCLELGSKAALARAIGIKAETIREWAIARESGELPVWADSNREDPRLNAGDKKQLKRVLRENEILKAKLARSEAAVTFWEKLPRSWTPWPRARRRPNRNWTHRSRGGRNG
jgi:transposase